LQKQLQHHQDQTKTLTENAKLIGELQAENERLKEENNRLNAELGSGKGRNTLLKMIAGMAIKGHAIDIYSTRIEGISELANDLADCGVQLDPKTISKCLKEAAKLIPRPQK
jgi:predicted nuclease with TOPRIM domain